MRFLAFFFVTFQLTHAAMSPLAKDMLSPDLTSKSYLESKEILENHEASLRSRIQESFRAPMKTGFTQYKLQNEKTPFVFIVIHGLYRNPGQFRHLYPMLEAFQQNIIYMNLPGHGMDMYAAKKVKHTDWIKALKFATNAAKRIGDKIIFITQSTGGALSLIHTLDHPEQVAGLFMIEPAIKVNPLLKTLVCVTHPVMSSLNWIYGFAGREDDLDQLPYMATRMGCEVDKLMSRYLKRHSKKRSRRQREMDLFPRIKVPVIIFNNMSDKIVSRPTIARFQNLISGPKHYVEIPRKGGSYHADEEFMFGVIQQQRDKVQNFFEELELYIPVQGL